MSSHGPQHLASLSQAHHVLHHTMDILSCPALVQGDIDESRMQNALWRVIQQHPALRTRFVIEAESVFRETSQPENLPLYFVDKRGVPKPALDDFMREYAQYQRHSLPKRNVGPLFSCSFIQYAQGSYFFLLTIDHIICDAWSIKLFADDLFRAYDDEQLFCTPALDDPFSDFITWQRNKVNSTQDKLLNFWSSTVAENKPSPLAPTGETCKQKFILSTELTELLTTTAQHTQVSVFTYLLATLKLLLCRLHQPDTLIRIVHSGRYRQPWKKTIGLFASSLFIHIPLADVTTLQQLLKSTQKALYQSIKWSFVPIEYFESLGKNIAAKIELDYMPLDLFAHPSQHLRLETLLDPTLEALQPDLDMQLLCYHQDKKLCFFVIYKSALFPLAEETLLNHYASLLQSMLTQRDLALAHEP